MKINDLMEMPNFIGKEESTDSISENIDIETTRNKPFTKSEKEKIERFFKLCEKQQRTDLPVELFGFKGEKDFSEVNDPTYSTYLKKEKVKLDNIWVQHDIGLKNLKTVYEHWDKAPLAELLKLKNGDYWMIEGHHRTALQRIAGRNNLDFIVEYSRKN